MLKNIFLKVEYDGTNYFGFQIQNKKHSREETIQAVIEAALEKLFNDKIRVVYTSRTDRGVHAYSQGVNFKVDTLIPLPNIKKALNYFLPQDIRVKKVKRVPLSFHSRFCVKSKVYRYIISVRKEPSVFERNFCWNISSALDLDKMKAISKRMTGKHDFSVFAKEAKKYKTCVREIKSIVIRKRGGYIYVDIEADGFLRGMARNIAAFLAAAGKGRISVQEALAVWRNKAVYINKPAPAQGLYLWKVKY